LSINLERGDRVAVVTMARGSVNAMDLDLCQRLSEAFGELASDDSVGAVVLTGAGRAFSAGVDLKQILSGGEGYARQFVDRLSECFLATLTVPKPVVAAVNGHAIAGGCVLAAACDHALVAEGQARIGLSELRVGVPFPTSALEIVRARLGTRTARAIFGASTYPPQIAAELGFVDEVTDSEGVVDAARAVAERLAAIPPGTFALAKRQLQAPLLATIATNAVGFDPEVVNGWASAETMASIRSFLEAGPAQR
jgi:enoyl-CoA hydratase